MGETHSPDFENYALCQDYVEYDYWFTYEQVRGRKEFKDTTSTRIAREICSECPALQECRDYAIKYDNLQGIWGGLDPFQRRDIRKMKGIKSIDFMQTYPSTIREFSGRKELPSNE